MFKDAQDFYKMARREGFTLGGTILCTTIVFFLSPFLSLFLWLMPESKDFGPFEGRKDLE